VRTTSSNPTVVASSTNYPLHAQSLDHVGLAFLAQFAVQRRKNERISAAAPLCAARALRRRCHRQRNRINSQDLQPFKPERVQFLTCLDDGVRTSKSASADRTRPLKSRHRDRYPLSSSHSQGNPARLALGDGVRCLASGRRSSTRPSSRRTPPSVDAKGTASSNQRLTQTLRSPETAGLMSHGTSQNGHSTTLLV
jgi:hypothetical protein